MLLENIFAGVIRVAALPLAVAADVVTMGGLLTDEDESYTIQAFNGIGQNVSKTLDELEK